MLTRMTSRKKVCSIEDKLSSEFLSCLDINGVHDIMSMISNDELSSGESSESSDYETFEDDGEDIVLIVDISPVDFEEYDYNLPTSDVQFVKNNEYFDYSDLVDTNADSQGNWVPEAANYDYYPYEDVNLETVIDEDSETLLDYSHSDEGVSVSEKTRTLKNTINEIYKQQKILHIILLLGTMKINVSNTTFISKPLQASV